MSKLIVCFALLSLFVGYSLEQSATTLAFNSEWNNAKDNSVKSTLTKATDGSLNYKLVHSKITTPGVSSAIFLRNNSTGYISAFNPTLTPDATTTTYSLAIPFKDFDNSATFPCTRVDNTTHTTATCSGFLSFILTAEYSGTNRDADFQVSNNKAMVKYEFTFYVITDKTAQAIVTTSIKTKINTLPCLNCGCTNECTAMTGFTAAVKVCLDATCATERANKTFIYGDNMYLEIDTTPNTRVFDIKNWYAASGTGYDQYEDLGVNYLSTTSTTAGKLLVTVPAAGPASTLGTDFSLKFTLGARPATLRQRFLQGVKFEAVSADVSGSKRSQPPKDPGNGNFSNYLSTGVFSLILLFVFFSF